METLINTEKMLLFAGILLFVSVCVILAIFLDLWDGVHTAKATNQRVHSHKLRVTIAKMTEYWRFLLIGFLVDCVGFMFAFYQLPFVVILFGTGLLVVEVKSMFEHASKRKSHTAELPAILQRIIDCSHEKDALNIVKSLIDNKNESTDR